MWFELEFTSSIHINFSKEERVFQIIFPMPLGTEIDKVKEIMPADWTAEKSEGVLGRYYLINKFSYVHVGVLTIQPKKAVIKVDETNPDGEAFWRAFGMRYPEFDPYDLRFGVLYLPGGKGVWWELDEFPKHSPQEVLEDVSHYAHDTRPCYVSFLLGNWHAKEDILTASCQEIRENGELGPNQGVSFFPLGGI